MNQQEPYSPIHEGHGNGEPPLNPLQILRNGQDIMLPSTTASDYTYSVADHRLGHSNPELTPISAVGWDNTYHDSSSISNDNQVSSFNLPAHYDHTLMTPVSMNGSPAMSARATSIFSGRDVKLEQLSPAAESTYSYDDSDFAGRKKQPMKHKKPSLSAHINTSNNNFPSIYVVPQPYYGNFGVSDGNSSDLALTTPHNQPYSPSVNTSVTFGPRSYISHAQTPPPSAKSPGPFRSHDGIPLLPGMDFSMSRPLTPRRLSAPEGKMDRGRVKKSPPRSRGRRTKRSTSTSTEGLHIPTDFNPDERLLIELKRQGHEWKQIVSLFIERTGQTSVQVPALQMRHKRARDRLKVSIIATC